MLFQQGINDHGHEHTHWQIQVVGPSGQTTVSLDCVWVQIQKSQWCLWVVLMPAFSLHSLVFTCTSRCTNKTASQNHPSIFPAILCLQDNIRRQQAFTLIFTHTASCYHWPWRNRAAHSCSCGQRNNDIEFEREKYNNCLKRDKLTSTNSKNG